MTPSSRLTAIPFAFLAWPILAAAQDGPGLPPVDPTLAWVASTLGPWGATVVVAIRLFALGERFVAVLDRAIVEIGRWRELAPGASLRIEHSHQGLERVRLELEPSTQGLRDVSG
jgi:hypothetical protein